MGGGKEDHTPQKNALRLQQPISQIFFFLTHILKLFFFRIRRSVTNLFFLFFFYGCRSYQKTFFFFFSFFFQWFVWKMRKFLVVAASCFLTVTCAQSQLDHCGREMYPESFLPKMRYGKYSRTPKKKKKKKQEQ